jgi:hypothetical protein
VHNSLVSHIDKIFDNAAILLYWEPGLEIIHVEPLNYLHTAFLKPDVTLLAMRFEDRIIVLLPELEGAACEWVLSALSTA